MKVFKILFLSFFVFLSAANAGTVWSDNFDDNNISDWTYDAATTQISGGKVTLTKTSTVYKNLESPKIDATWADSLYFNATVTMSGSLSKVYLDFFDGSAYIQVASLVSGANNMKVALASQYKKSIFKFRIRYRLANTGETIVLDNCKLNGPGQGFYVMPSTKGIFVGETIQFSTKNSVGNVTWSVDNGSVADINSNGLLTAKSAGTVKVTAQDTRGIKGVATITVAEKYVGAFTEGFENGTSKWLLEGTWGVSTTFNTGSKSLADSPVGNYSYWNDISAECAIDLSGVTDKNAVLSYYYKTSIEKDWDFVFVDISSDGKNWNTLKTYTGDIANWTKENLQIGGYISQSNVRLRIRLLSDAGTHTDGIYIDDISLTTSASDATGPAIEYNYPGIYSAAPNDNVIKATILDPSGIKEAKLSYKVDNGSFNTINGTLSTNNIYSFTIPKQTHGSIVEYKFDAVDNSNNASTLGNYKYISGVIQAVDGLQSVKERYSEAEGLGDVKIALSRMAIPSNTNGNPATLVGIIYYIHNLSSVTSTKVYSSDYGYPSTELASQAITTTTIPTDPHRYVFVDLRSQSAKLSNLKQPVFVGFYDGASTPAGNIMAKRFKNTAPQVGVSTIWDTKNNKWAETKFNLNDANGNLITPYYATWHIASVWASDKSPYSDIEDKNISKEFNLYQNYPNPFNPSTTIAYDIKGDKEQLVKISIFNINGELVSSLVNGNQKAGSYKVTFDGSKLTSGVYYYTLSLDNKVMANRKMILVK